MHVDHPHAHLGRGLDGHRRGIRDVVEFEVEEHVKALGLQCFDNRRPAAGEQLFADLYPALCRIKLRRQRQGCVGVREIEGNDNRAQAGHGSFSGKSKRRALYLRDRPRGPAAQR